MYLNKYLTKREKLSHFISNLTEYLSERVDRFKSTGTMLNSVIMRSLLERDFCATEICHFVNHEYVDFSCYFITVNLNDEEKEVQITVDENDKINFKEKDKSMP